MKTTKRKSTTQQHQIKQSTTAFFQKEKAGESQHSEFGGVPGQSTQSFFSGNIIQPKLQVGKPNDKYEQEADTTADSVVNQINTPAAGNAIQKKCADCDKKEEGAIQTKSMGGETTASSGLQSQLSSTKGGGQALPEDTRSSMGAAMGADFSGVRVHTDNSAVQMNQELGAHAFTHGSDVYFNKGKYDTKSRDGQRLLAHELTHVVQQTGSKQNSTTNKPSVQPLIQRNLKPPGNCLQGIHDGLQKTVKSWCDHPFGRHCSATDSCSRLQQKINRNQMCAKSRKTINDQCYEGGDAGHRIAERDARRAQATCMALYRGKCEKKKEPKSDFLKRMAEITGLTGAALIIYLIISEGSRLFPPRNLVPIP